MAKPGLLAGDTLIVDRSRTPGAGSIVNRGNRGQQPVLST